jgi:hypothetical protein
MPTSSQLHVSAISLATLILVLLANLARAATPSTCESLTNFKFADTTINSATSYPGGAYVAPDAWHLAFTNLPRHPGRRSLVS